MKFILEVDLDAGVMPAGAIDELGRILRYWAGNLKHYDLSSGTASEQISDSSYAPVGRWRVEK
jgi:hypothetical protein